MGFWSLLRGKEEQRVAQETVLSEAQMDTVLWIILGGTKVTVEDMLSIPTISSGVEFVAGTIASLPIWLYQTKGGNSAEVMDDYRLRLLNEETGDLLDVFQWEYMLVRDYLLTENGCTYVNWAGSHADSLYYVDPMQVNVEIDADPVYKAIRFYIGGARYSSWQMFRMLRNTKDGAVGCGVVEESPIQLETMLSALRYENHIVCTGERKGSLKAKNRLAADMIQQLKSSQRNLYGNDSEESIVVLDDGIEFQDASQTTVESQLNENKATSDHKIFKIFHIVPSVLEGDATAEDLEDTVRFAIQPIVKALQTTINRYCLLGGERETSSFKIDLDVLDNTGVLSRYQAYEVTVRNRQMQLDEVRYEGGRNPLGLKSIHLDLDTAIYDPDIRTVYTLNTKE